VGPRALVARSPGTPERLTHEKQESSSCDAGDGLPARLFFSRTRFLLKARPANPSGHRTAEQVIFSFLDPQEQQEQEFFVSFFNHENRGLLSSQIFRTKNQETQGIRGVPKGAG